MCVLCVRMFDVVIPYSAPIVPHTHSMPYGTVSLEARWEMIRCARGEHCADSLSCENRYHVFCGEIQHALTRHARSSHCASGLNVLSRMYLIHGCLAGVEKYMCTDDGNSTRDDYTNNNHIICNSINIYNV